MRPVRWSYLASTAAFLVLCASLASWLRACGQTPGPHAGSGLSLQSPAVRWAEAAAVAEEHVVNYDRTLPLEYKFQRRDSRGELSRYVIESREGSVARLLERNGTSLTKDEDDAERARLQSILDSPEAFHRHMERDEGERSYAIELLRAMPKAMLWAYVPGQPQLPDSPGLSIVLDFQPDPHYKPPSLITDGLTGIAGRVWIDEESHCVVRIEGRILHQVNFGWGGVLAKVREGGQVEFDQRRAENGRWLYSHLLERLTIREMMVHTVEENADTRAVEVRALPHAVSYREAVQRLLALPVPTH